jgi:dTDP-4-amino-4,6-dideoxygalactose transaminase
MLAGQTGDRRHIALPAYGCYDLVTAALGANVPVRWYDLDPATLGPDWPSLEAALGAGTGAVVVVHYYGVPVDMDAVGAIARRHDVLVIEDAAQGIGGAFNHLPLGATGDLGVLSFGRGKGLTGGSGGALLVNSPSGRKALAGLERSLDPGRVGLTSLVATAGQWLLARPSVYGLPSSIPALKLGETVFRHPEPLREISRVAPALLLASRRRIGAEGDTRRANADWFKARFGSRVRVPTVGAGVPGYLRLPVLFETGRRTKPGGSGMQALGIKPGYPKVLNSLPFPTASHEIFAGAEELVASLVTVPVHSRISGRDREEILNWMEGQ